MALPKRPDYTSKTLTQKISDWSSKRQYNRDQKRKIRSVEKTYGKPPKNLKF